MLHEPIAMIRENKNTKKNLKKRHQNEMISKTQNMNKLKSKEEKSRMHDKSA